jgi:hypothetical protein
MTDAQNAISILSAVFVLIITIMNLTSIHDYKVYKKKYDELFRGLYKFEPTPGLNNIYFYLYDYDINTQTRSRTNVEIIFFTGGDIKLTDNVYIHKSQLWMSFVSWYYYRKFHRLKDDTIREYHIREAFRTAGQNRESVLYERYMKQQRLDFKFFRG